MSELWGHLIGVFIVFMIVSFLGMWVWVWQKRHKPKFDKMAAIPMKDVSDEPKREASAGEKLR